MLIHFNMLMPYVTISISVCLDTWVALLVVEFCFAFSFRFLGV